MKKSASSRFRQNAVLAVCSLIIAAFFYPLMLHMIQFPASDIYLHTEFADLISLRTPSTWFYPIAHPLWHFVVRFLRLFGMPFNHAGVLFTTLIKIAELLAVNWFYTRQLSKRIDGVWISLLSFVTVMVSAICIPWINPHVYLNAGTPNTWHSPTQILMIFWMLLSVFFLSSSYDRQLKFPGNECDLTWKKAAVFSVFLVACLLSKPLFILCFFPGAAIYFLIQWIHNPRFTRYYIRLLISLIPTFLFIILPANTYFGAETDSGIQFIFNPQLIADTVQAALLTNAFPFVVLLINRKKQTSTITPITLWTYACACLINAFLCETGFRADHGNFGWAMLGSAMLLWVIAIPQYVEMVLENQTKSGKRINVACGVLLAWHFFSGIYYIYYLFTSGKWY